MSRREEEEAEQKRLQEIRYIKLPKRENLEMFGTVTQLHGTNQIRVMCEDKQERMCRIPGKMKKRVWIRENDVVIVRLWDFQPIKADIVWRFTGIQSEHLRKKGYLDKLLQ
ncbi:MAG: translation initiation factor eIF-1A [Candidatus Diapherotrites archaeon]